VGRAGRSRRAREREELELHRGEEQDGGTEWRKPTRIINEKRFFVGYLTTLDVETVRVEP
jgi:hypothetical protein